MILVISFAYNASNKVSIISDINNNYIGEYIVTYSVVNSRGYSNSITRKVNVISKESDLVVDYTISPNNLTNEDVTIKLSVSGEFNKIIYPDKSEGKELSYIVKENGNELESANCNLPKVYILTNKDIFGREILYE